MRYQTHEPHIFVNKTYLGLVGNGCNYRIAKYIGGYEYNEGYFNIGLKTSY